MDAAKAMRLFHESPELSVRELSLPFLDARKRIATFPQVAHDAAADRDPDHVGHRLGGLAGRGDQRRRAQGDARRLLARARHGDRRSRC